MTSAQKRERKDSMRLARTLFIIFVVFATCWTPYAIIVAIDYKDEFTQEVHLFAILLAHTNSSLNFILYGLTNRHFKQGYIALLGLNRLNCVRKNNEYRSTMIQTCEQETQTDSTLTIQRPTYETAL